jgi:glutamate formiminotransferase
MGVYLADRDQAQVSMNLLDFARTPLHVVQERVSEEAAIRGVKISSAEIIGLIPQSALVTAAAHYLQIDSFSPHLILENAIEDKTVR